MGDRVIQNITDAAECIPFALLNKKNTTSRLNDSTHGYAHPGLARSRRELHAHVLERITRADLATVAQKRPREA
jgi:hypothetical protein